MDIAPAATYTTALSGMADSRFRAKLVYASCLIGATLFLLIGLLSFVIVLVRSTDVETVLQIETARTLLYAVINGYVVYGFLTIKRWLTPLFLGASAIAIVAYAVSFIPSYDLFGDGQLMSAVILAFLGVYTYLIRRFLRSADEAPLVLSVFFICTLLAYSATVFITV